MLGISRPRSTANHAWDPDDVPWLVSGFVAIGVLLVGIGLMIDYSALDVWTATLVFLVLIVASVPAFSWVATRDGDPWLFKALMVGLLVKFAGSMARYFMIFVMYGGSADAGRYHEAGVTFVNRLRDGVPIHPIDIMQGFPPETQRIADVVGGLYVVTGPSAYAGFLVFSYICYWGQVLMVRGFRVAVPEGDHRRFTLLMLFVPSLVFWPSSLGKEALMIGCLGLITYGGALLLAPKPQVRGAGFFVAGSLLVLLVRPHVAIMAIGALAVAMAVGLLGGFNRDAPKSHSARGRMIRFFALGVILVLAMAASTRLAETFNGFGEEGSTIESLEGAADQTSRGGSEFEPMAITGPSRLPAGVITVFFRPFPWEVDSVNGLIAGSEGLLLVVLLAISWRRLLSLPKLALRRPFLVFSLTYVLLFSIGFSFISNFGILTRQRVQALVVLLVVLALPKAQMPSLSFRRKDKGREREPGLDEIATPPWAATSPVQVGQRRPGGVSVLDSDRQRGSDPSDPFATGVTPSRESDPVTGSMFEMGGHASVVDR